MRRTIATAQQGKITANFVVFSGCALPVYIAQQSRLLNLPKTMYSQKLDTIAQQRKDVTKLTEEFNEGLQSFEENFHDECETKGCEHYQKKIRDLYKDYYTCLVPGRWDESRSEYREQLARDIESSMPLEEVHARVLEEKRQARINQKDIISEWRERELSNHPGDHLETIRFKDQATAMLNNGNALEEVMKFMNEEAHKVLSIIPGNRHILLDQINTAMTPEQKRQAKKEWHTFPAENDSPQTRDFKHNLSRMFDSDMPLDEIDSSIIQYKKQQDYRSGIHEELIRAKRSKIEENIYAWRAHVRSKKEKNERAVARAAERKASQKDYNTHLCSGFDDLGIPCRNHAAPVDEDRGPLECAICDRAIENGRHIRRSFFCSSSCAERSWVSMLETSSC